MSTQTPVAALGSYSVAEEIANAVTHGIAALLSVVGLIAMLYVAVGTSDAVTITAAAVFGASMIFLYTASTLYLSLIHI